MRKVISVLAGALMILAGIYCLITPEMTYLTFAWVIGISMILDGAGRVINWFLLRKIVKVSGWHLAGAIVSLVFGLVLVGDGLLQFYLDMFIITMAAIWIAAIGVIRIAHALQLRKIRTAVQSALPTTFIGQDWWIGLILGILLTLFGVLSLFHPIVLMMTIGIDIGIAVIMACVNMIHLGTASWLL